MAVSEKALAAPRARGSIESQPKPSGCLKVALAILKDFLNSYPNVEQIGSGMREQASQNNVVKLQIPLFSSTVAAGVPSPAEDHIDDTLDLNDYMVQRPDTTFMLRVEGESMKNVGILPNDILIVDRSLEAKHNKIVIAALDGELTVKRLFHRGGLIKLLPENPAYPEIEIAEQADLKIWGVVIGSFRRFQSF